ncbi:MAG: hypothetical protein ACP5HM_06250 [Anaerolineae bacterium]
MLSNHRITVKDALLWGLLSLSLLLNVLSLLYLTRMRQRARLVLETAQTTVRTLQEEPIRTDVEVDQKIPIQEVINLDETFSVPLDTTYPLSTVVQTSVQIPLLGRQAIAVPVEAQIPIQMDLTVPVQTQIPISFTYHLQTTLPVEITLSPETWAPLNRLLGESLEALK